MISPASSLLFFLVLTRDASAFLTKMSEAVNSYQPAGH